MARIWTKHKQLNTTLKPKVFVAMSGGVDSSVAAALLKKQGHKVTGVFFKPWTPPVNSSCLWQQDRQDAMKVCAKLGIPFKTWDFSKEYEKEVVRYMIDSYRSGITPNPDVMCNKEIKFGLFLKKALVEGADCIATGHYVRLRNVISNPKLVIRRSKNQLPVTSYQLLIAKDSNKDQSYFLWTLTQDQLKHCIFPIGDYTKPGVRKLAKKFGLPNHDKKDSQGVCFIGQLDMKKFLKKYIKSGLGKIIHIDTDKIIGRHDGAYYYTIGQRHGLDIKDGKGPYFVVSKNIQKNIIYVTNTPSKLNIKNPTSKIEKISWVSKIPKLPLNCQIKIRYRSKSIPATVSKKLVKFKKHAKALTPGQSAVFYRGQEVLGGGILSRSIASKVLRRGKSQY
ncbi:MAG: tRNA 2-thiouridine(34) synthase MnmA [Candidatus Yanofskybacteria bacterium]|nr:tRNA 2-thiouridine(34) synthase MnmA [Candidatus Yanofskybacteria bacterium]